MNPVTDKQVNLQTFFTFMEEATEQGAHLIVFPEISLQQHPAWGRAEYEPSEKEIKYLYDTAETIPGESTKSMADRARELNT